jgi:hypothetical protein
VKRNRQAEAGGENEYLRQDIDDGIENQQAAGFRIAMGTVVTGR